MIGTSYKRIDARAKVKGEALYPGDFNFTNQLYMKVYFSDRPHAIIKNIDIASAEKSPGVVAVYTAKDVPNNEYGLILADQPVLCGPGSGKPFGDRVRFIGDQIAVVVAENETAAKEAIRLIRVEYEDLPVITDVFQALKDDSACIHPDNGGNIIMQQRIRKGDAETAFRQADIIVEGEYHTPVQEHAYLQPEAGVAYLDEEGRITVVVAGQWTHEDQEQVAHALNLPLNRVRIIYPAIGGAFGGREDMSIQIILGLAVMRLHERGIDRPIKIIWNREESIVGHGKRHPYHIQAKWGATREGKIIAAEVNLVADAGAYLYTSGKVLGNAVLMCTGPYEIANVKVDGCAVYTNNLPSAAFRGFGGPQAAFAAEMQINKLAEKLNLDPVEIRMRNVVRDGSILSVNSPMPEGVSMPQVVEHCALAAGWRRGEMGWNREPVDQETAEPSGGLRKGIGFSCSFKNVGFSYGAPEKCSAMIELEGKETVERVILHHAGAEVGQGAHTVFAQMTAEALNVPIERVELVVSDTATSDNSGSVSASRMTFMAGNAIKGAAELALQKWQAEERPCVATYTYYPPPTTPPDPQTGECVPNFAYGYVAEAVEVEVDTETGHIMITKVYCADDVGKAVNPQLVVGQIEGAIVQAAGYAILENFIQKEGFVRTPTLSTYLIPTILDIPGEVQSMLLEYADPRGAWGIRGMGEMPFLPLTPALMAAVHQATGVWFDSFPLTPERVLRGLGKLG